MIRASFYEAAEDAAMEGWIGPGWKMEDLVREVLSRSSGCGHPAAELSREDGSSVTLGTDGERAVLVWIDSLGDSHHSMGDGDGTHLVYDYFGSWSEVPSDWLVPLAHAIEAMEEFVQSGMPVTERVIFQPD